MSESLLSIENLRVQYATANGYFTAVSGVDLKLYPNEVFGIVGESGSGKSTMAMSLLRLLPPSSRILADRVDFKGASILQLSEKELRRLRWEHISYIPQSAMNTLNPVITIREHFEDTIVDHEGKRSRQELNSRIEAALARVNLNAGVAGKYAHELSGGMKQRVCIAMATLLTPELIIADEPTSALDVISQRAVLQILSEVRKTLAASMIMIGHDMALQAQIADRMGIMFAGYFVEIGSVSDIFNNPIHPYTKGLIQAIPSIRKKQNIHTLASYELTEEQRRAYSRPGLLREVTKGHFASIIPERGERL